MSSMITRQAIASDLIVAQSWIEAARRIRFGEQMNSRVCVREMRP
jgi:hypothetical protein